MNGDTFTVGASCLGGQGGVAQALKAAIETSGARATLRGTSGVGPTGVTDVTHDTGY